MTFPAILHTVSWGDTPARKGVCVRVDVPRNESVCVLGCMYLGMSV